MKQVAARIPPAMLAGQVRDPRVRYVAQAFTPRDDPGLTEGWFEDPAAALAFGCAVDRGGSLACLAARGDPELTQIASGIAGADQPAYDAVPFEDLAPGWRCRRLGVAVGSPVFEPDRCVLSVT